MKILDHLISTLNLEAEVRDIRLGSFQTAVLTRYCGLAATLPDDGNHHESAPVKEAGNLIEKKASELVKMVYSASSLEATIGMATINSLLEIDERHCLDVNAGDLMVEKGRDKRVALIGHFPFVPGLRQVTKELWVVERRLREGDFGEERADELVPQADVVGITGTAFINHTIEHLLSLCRPQAYVIILGGTTPLSPVLFDYGATAIAGTKVIDPEVVLRGVSQGATHRQLKGIRRLIMTRRH